MIAIRIRSLRELSLNIFLFLLFGVLCCRGVLEMALPKSVAMVAQLGSVSICLSWIFLTNIRDFRKRAQVTLILALAFLMTAVASAFLTSVVHSFHHWTIYLAFNGYLLWVAVGALRIKDADIPNVAFHKIILFWGWALFLVALVEQLGFIHMPGYSFIGPLIRSASLTGSFLHYPIVMALFAYLTIQWWELSGDRAYLISGCVFFVAPVMVASRSGMFIGLFTLLLAWVVGTLRGERKALWLTCLLGAGFLLLLVAGSTNDNSVVDKLADRVLRAGNMDSAGNSGRMRAWVDAIDAWLSSNLIVGEFTGTITNSTKSVFEGRSTVAESGVLQQLVNFGFAGLFLFYGLLSRVYFSISNHHRWLRLVFVAAMVQTLFYQSIEVVPFITVLLLLPWISSQYERQMVSA